MIYGGHLVAKMLAVESVDVVFTLCGGHIMPIYGVDCALGSALALTRYDKVVEALGGYGEHVEEPGAIRPALERALASCKPACVSVRVDEGECGRQCEFDGGTDTDK